MPTPTPPLFVNIHQGASSLEAFETVHTDRHEATEAAEEFSESYQFTLTDAGKIDLSAEFGEGWQEKRDFDAAVDAKIDDLKERRFG